MSIVTKVPEWAVGGPEDLEYRTYKMLSHVKKLRDTLKEGKLWDALTEAEEVIEFLYRYDAERYLDEDMLSTKLTRADWENIEFVYTTGVEIVHEDILDILVEKAIEEYEGIHSEIREFWRNIDSLMTISQSGNKPYFVNDGFVLVHTPDNKTHIYTFKNPKVNSILDWRAFKLKYVDTFSYDKEEILRHIGDLREKDDSKIIYRVSLKNTVKLEDGAINVISSNVFMKLKKDYSF